MGTTKVTFRKCIQDSVDYGSDDEHMVSAVFFDLEINGQTHPDLSIQIRQIVGGSTLEIGDLRGYTGPLNRRALHEAVEGYFRDVVGPQGLEDSAGGRMQNNVFLEEKTVEFEG